MVTEILFSTIQGRNTNAKVAAFWVALGCLLFLASTCAKNERWFKCFVSLGGFWLACGVLHLILAVVM